MKPYIWESSIMPARTPKFFVRKARTASKMPSTAKPQTSKNQESFWENFSQPSSFLFSKSRLSNRPKTRNDPNLNLHITEEIRISEQSNGNFEKPTLEKYEDDKKEDQNFMIHTYARPRRLVAIRDKQTSRDNEEVTKKMLASPTIRIGIAGWKLSRPKSLSPNPKIYKDQNQFLQIISKKL